MGGERMIGGKRAIYVAIGLLIVLGTLSVVFAPPMQENMEKTQTHTKALYQWTVMCYLDGDNNLDTYGDADLSEFQTAGTAPGVAVIIIKDDSVSGDSALYVGADGGAISQVTTGLPTWWPATNELDMGDVNLLINFIEWCMVNYPAEKYWLDMWDHGGSLYGECWDDTDGTNIDLADLVTALETVHQDTGDWIDVISHDECLMAQNGVNYNQMLFTNYTVSSEDSIGGDGFEYQNVMPHINNDPSISPEAFALAICDEYYLFYGTSGLYTTLSCINNTLYHHYMIEALNAFGQKLMHQAGTLNTQITTARDNAAAWQATAGYDFDRDMVDFCYQIQAQIPATTDAEIYNSADRLINISDPDADGSGVIMMHNQNAGEYGIKAYVENGASYRTDYDLSWITVETNWDDFVKAMLASTDYPNEEPIIEMTSPVNGTKIYSTLDIPNINTTTVYGVVNISGTLSDPDSAPPYDTTVYRVEICIDRNWWDTTSVNLAPDGTWWFNWDTSLVPEGLHHIMVRAYDGQDWSEYYEHAWLNVVHNTPPTVDITYPLAGDVVSGTINIQWTASDIEDGTALTIDIYYSTDNATWTPIVTGTSNTGSYPWDTTAVPDGQYYIKVVATDSQGATGEDVEGPFWVDNVPSPPSVEITWPNAGDVLSPGSVCTVQYNAYDNDPTGSITAIDIYASYDGGTTWTALATGLANTGTYDWNVPEGYADNVYLKVVATDNDGMQANDTSGPLKIAEKLYFQIQTSAIAGYENLSKESLESTINEKLVDVSTGVGDYLVGQWITDAFASNHSVVGVWNFSVYGKKNGLMGGFFYARVLRYNSGTPVELFTTPLDDENISLYTDYHEFTWSYDFSGNGVIPAGDRVIVEIWLNVTYAEGQSNVTPNPDVDTDSTGWTYYDWNDGTYASGTWQSTGGNPSGYLEVSISAPTAGSSAITYNPSGYWELAFTPSFNPTYANLYLDWTCTAFGAGQTGATIYVYVETATGLPSTTPVWQTSVTGTSAWTSVGPIDVSSIVTSSTTTYYIKVAFEVTGVNRGDTYPWTVGFDNVRIEYGKPSEAYMAYDYSSTPSYVVMPYIPSHTIYGYVYYSDGTPAANVQVNITDPRTGITISVYTDATGYYSTDIATLRFLSGDTVNVDAYDSTTGGTGSNSTTIDTSVQSQQVDVTLNTVVPELTAIAALAAIAVLALITRRFK